MTSVSVYILSDQTYSNIIRYVLYMISHDLDLEIHFVDTADDTDWIFDHTSSQGEHLHLPFYSTLREPENESLDETYSGGNVRCDNGQIDYMASIFFMVNCLQETSDSSDNLDQYGRFRFKASYQYEEKSFSENKVQKLINQFLINKGIKVKKNNARLFISHDIDFLYGSRKEDLIWAAKNLRLGYLLKIIFNEVSRKPHWRNVDKVIALDSAYDIRATFFWLVNAGIGVDGIPNADYHLSKEKKLIDLVDSSNCYNGLHKSASSDSMSDELKKSGYPWKYNRNHYLRFQTHDHWRAISEAGIKLDCSLGFAEQIGFRNSYGKPFTPYDLENDKSYDFVEMPLHVMDATFLHYLKMDPTRIAPTVIDFIEKNKEDCVLSLLWHNNYLTEYSYRPFLDAYKAVLGYVYENQFETVDPDKIIECYLLSD